MDMGKIIPELHEQENAVNTLTILFQRSLTLLYKCTNRTLLGFCIHTVSVFTQSSLQVASLGYRCGVM